MKCIEFEKLINEYLDNELNKADSLIVEKHMENCEACKYIYEDLLELKSLFTDLEEVELPKGFNDELHSKLLEVANEDKESNVIPFERKTHSLDTDERKTHSLDSDERKTHSFRSYFRKYKVLASLAAVVLISVVAIRGADINLNSYYESSDSMASDSNTESITNEMNTTSYNTNLTYSESMHDESTEESSPVITATYSSTQEKAELVEDEEVSSDEEVADEVSADEEVAEELVTKELTSINELDARSVILKTNIVDELRIYNIMTESEVSIVLQTDVEEVYGYLLDNSEMLKFDSDTLTNKIKDTITLLVLEEDLEHLISTVEEKFAYIDRYTINNSEYINEMKLSISDLEFTELKETEETDNSTVTDEEVDQEEVLIDKELEQKIKDELSKITNNNGLIKVNIIIQNEE